MGNLNLLQSGYTGTLGETYGVKQYGKLIMKAIPSSHTPHNEAQKKSLSAFTKLNRMSAVIAKNFWQYLSLSDKKMYRSNAVAQWLKPLIANKEFNPELLLPYLGNDPDIAITGTKLDGVTKTFKATFVNTSGEMYLNNEKICAYLVTDNGEVKGVSVENVRPATTLTFDINMFNFKKWYFVILHSTFKGKKWETATCVTSGDNLIVINGVWYTKNMQWNVKPRVENGVLYLSSQDASVVNGVLRLNKSL